MYIYILYFYYSQGSLLKVHLFYQSSRSRIFLKSFKNCGMLLMSMLFCVRYLLPRHFVIQNVRVCCDVQQYAVSL